MLRDAWDPVTGKRIWSMPYKAYNVSSGYVDARQHGRRSGVSPEIRKANFLALDAKSGNKLWSYSNRRGKSRRARSRYAVNGRQFIATSTGWHVSVVGAALLGLFPDQDWRLGSTTLVCICPAGGIAMKVLIHHGCCGSVLCRADSDR